MHCGGGFVDMLAASALGADKMAFNFIILDLYGFVNLEHFFTLDSVVNTLKLLPDYHRASARKTSYKENCHGIHEKTRNVFYNHKGTKAPRHCEKKYLYSVSVVNAVFTLVTNGLCHIKELHG
jgi:hypothetical protein